MFTGRAKAREHFRIQKLKPLSLWNTSEQGNIALQLYRQGRYCPCDL